MSSELITHTTDSSFEADVLASELPVIVDFWAEWCGPCKMIAPVLDALAEDYQGRVKICKIDVDANKEMAAKFAVRGIPTIMLFDQGELKETKVGALSKAQLNELINGHLGS